MSKNNYKNHVLQQGHIFIDTLILLNIIFSRLFNTPVGSGDRFTLQ